VTDADLRVELIALLNETGRAHHRAYQASNGADAEWPLWYAEAMQARLNGLIGAGCTRSELIYWLVRAEKERSSLAPGVNWAEDYADFFLKQSGAMPAAPKAADEL
jgi:hypothetical protein